MANELLTPAIIAQEALMVLQNNLVFGNLVNKDYSAEFAANVGDTITVRKPNTFTVDEFNGSINIQDVKESGVPVKLDKLLDVSFSIGSKDLTLTITDFSERFIQPAMQAFAQDIDSRLAQLALQIPYYVGTAGTTPSAVADITAVRQKMNENKVPMAGRKLVLDPSADAKLLQLDAFNRVDATGTDGAIRNAELGRKFGYDVYMDQNIASVDNTGLTATAPTLSAAANVGDTTMSITGTTLTGTIKKGTLFTVAGSTQTFVVTEDATAAANAATIKISPAVKAGIASSSALTLVADHTANIAFHKNAFSLVSRRLDRPMGGANSAALSYNGLGLRVVEQYDISTKANVVSIDGLFGFTVLTPELACVLLG